MVMPNSVSLSLLPEEELQELMQKKVDSRPEPSPMALPKGVLSVQLIEAKNLSGSGNKYEDDLFACVTLEADRQTHAYRTNSVSGSPHPAWNMLLDLPVDDPDSLKDVRVEIFQKCPVGFYFGLYDLLIYSS